MCRACHDGRDFQSLGKKSAHLPALRNLLRSQHGKRIAVYAVEDGFEFLRSHAQLLWQRVRMKKAELHVHLEGSIGPDTLMMIDPSLAREEIELHLTCASFAEFLQGYIW